MKLSFTTILNLVIVRLCSSNVKKYEFENLRADFLADYHLAFQMTSEILVLELIHRMATCLFEVSKCSLWCGGERDGDQIFFTYLMIFLNYNHHFLWMTKKCDNRMLILYFLDHVKHPEKCNKKLELKKLLVIIIKKNHHLYVPTRKDDHNKKYLER